jgi:signal transduction histidine kinase
MTTLGAVDDLLLGDPTLGTAVDGSDTVATLDSSSELTILLIEDSSSDSELVIQLLQDEFVNADIHTATNLERALVMLDETPYDLVLADLTLPDADGATVVQSVRTAHPTTALMVLTGRIDGALALWALAEGAQDYLVKGQHDGPRLATAMLHGLQRCRAEQNAHTQLLAALNKESQAVHRLHELNELKNDFVATVSHELRTPLTSISAYTEMLQEETSLSPQHREWVDTIARNTFRLTSLTDDLLLMSRFGSVGYAVKARPVDLTTVVRRAEEVLAGLGTGRSLDMSFALPDSPVVVLGDADHLERVVLNLMGNAIKFSHEGGSISCRLSRVATEAVLTVTDAGIGIPAAEQVELFTKFFRGASARNRAIQGTGLGLYIVATIVKNHGGQISVESGGGQGSTFTVRIPLAPE